MKASKITLALLLLIALTGCRHTKPVAEMPSVTTTNTTTHEESGGLQQTGYTKPDSAYIIALLECDSANQVYLKSIEELKTGHNVTPEIRLRNNYIYLKCKVDSSAVWLRWNRFYNVKADTVQVVKYLPGTVTNKINGFQRLMISAGIIACVALLLFIIFKAIKPKLI